MPSGKAPIAEASTVDAFLALHRSHRRPVHTGLLALLTIISWGLWFYLVMPLVSLLLWVFGVRILAEQIGRGGYEGLISSLLGYAAVLSVLVGLLALWIAWNVARYGGRHERRTVRRAGVSDVAVLAAFRLDESLLPTLRERRLLRADLDRDGCVVVIADAPPRAPGPEAGPAPAAPPQPQRERGSTRPG